MFRVLEYREPFAGGMSVGLNMFEQSRRGGWINDIDPGVYASWTAAKLFPDHLQASVWRSDPTVKAFNTLKQFFLANPPSPTLMPEIVEMAVRKLAIHKMSFSYIGELGTVYGGQAQMRSVAERWNRKLICHRIDRIHPILRDVQVTNVDSST